MWIATSDLPVDAANDLYAELDDALKAFGFGDHIWELAEPSYCADVRLCGRSARMV